MDPEERAREGVFLAFQYPVEIPGVSNTYFLKAALNAVRKHRGLPEMDAVEFLTLVREKMKLVQMDETLLNRPVNEGFSGGEKKRNEIFQMAVLEPQARRSSTRPTPGSTSTPCASSPTASTPCAAKDRAFLVITHYQRLLNYIVPDFVHVLVGRPDRRARAARSWRWSWRRRATPGSRRRRSRPRSRWGREAMAVTDDSRAPRGDRFGVDGYAATSSAGGERAGRSRLAAGDAPRRAIGALRGARLPHPRQEEWRLTNVGPDRPGAVPAAPDGDPDAVAPERDRALRLRRPPRGWCSWTAASRPGCPSAASCPRGRRRQPRRGAGAAIAELVEPWLGRYAELRATSRSSRSTRRFLRDGAFVHVPRGAASTGPIHLLFLSAARGRAADAVLSRATSSWPARTARRRWSRPTPARGGAYFTCPVTEMVAGRRRRGRPLQGAAREPRGLPRRHLPGRSRSAQPASLALDLARRRPGAQRRQRRARRRGERLHPERPLHRRRPAASSTTTCGSSTPSPTAPATSSTRASSTARRGRSSTA